MRLLLLQSKESASGRGLFVERPPRFGVPRGGTCSGAAAASPKLPSSDLWRSARTPHVLCPADLVFGVNSRGFLRAVLPFAAFPGTEVGTKLGFCLQTSSSAAARTLKQESDLGSNLFEARRENSSRCSA